MVQKFIIDFDSSDESDNSSDMDWEPSLPSSVTPNTNSTSVPEQTTTTPTVLGGPSILPLLTTLTPLHETLDYLHHNAVTLADEDRWTQVQLLLHDDTIRLYTRIAGLFVLLYAQPLARVARMRADQITVSTEGVVVSAEPTMHHSRLQCRDRVSNPDVLTDTRF